MSAKSHNYRVPVWVWVFAGILLGLLIAYIIYLTEHGTSGSNTRQGHSSGKANSRQSAKGKGGINYEFYDYLPKMEVVIPEEELAPTLAKDAKPTIYFLQVGSFRGSEDADSRRAQLAILGISSKTEKVDIKGKGTWHRVRLGPFKERRILDKTVRSLQDNKVDFILLKETT